MIHPEQTNEKSLHDSLELQENHLTKKKKKIHFSSLNPKPIDLLFINFIKIVSN